MTPPAHASLLSSTDAWIDTCLAEFDVSAPRGPLSSPETLLAAVRREILPALSEVLEEPHWQDIEVVAPRIEIDLGTWPDEPDWQDVRTTLVVKLRAALEFYIPQQVKKPSPLRAAMPVPDNETDRLRNPQHSDTAVVLPNVGANRSNTFQPAQKPDHLSGLSPNEQEGDADTDHAALLEGDDDSSRRETNKLHGKDTRARSGEPFRDAAMSQAQGNKLPPEVQADEIEGPIVRDAETRAADLGQNTNEAFRTGSVSRIPEVETDQQATESHQAEIRGTHDTDVPMDVGSNKGALSKSDVVEQIVAFTAWFEAQEQIPTGDVISRFLSTRPGVAEALAVWRATPPEARPATIPIPEVMQLALSETKAEYSRGPTQSTQKQRPKHKFVSDASRGRENPQIKATSEQDTEATGSENPAQVAEDAAQPGQTFELAGSQGKPEPAPKGAGNRSESTVPLDEPSALPAVTALKTTERTEQSRLPNPVDHILEVLRNEARENAPRHQKLMAAESRLRASLLRSGLEDNAARIASLHVLAKVMDRPESPLSDRSGGVDQTEKTDKLANEQRYFQPPATEPEKSPETILPASQIRKEKPSFEGAPQGQSSHENLSPDSLTSEPNDQSSPADYPPVQNKATEATAQMAQDDPLRELASYLGVTGQSQFAAFIVSELARQPAAVFAASLETNTLFDLAALLADAELGPRAFQAIQRFDVGSFKLLAQANPMALATAIGRLETDGALALVLHLLPPQAELLKTQIAALKDRAKEPRIAVQGALLALLQDRTLDLEVLAELQADPSHPVSPVPGAQTDVSDAVLSPTPLQIETPLEVMLTLSGLTAREIDRVLGRDARPDGEKKVSDKNDATVSAQGQLTKEQRSDAALRDHLWDLLPSRAAHAEEALRLIWEVWPRRQASEPQGAVDEFPLLRARLAAQPDLTGSSSSLADCLRTATRALEANDQKRTYALRTVAARLAHVGGPDAFGLHATTRTAIEQVLSPAPQADTTPEKKAIEPPRGVDKGSATQQDGEETLLVSETAGLVLLHPFYVLLFDRMKIARDAKSLDRNHLSRALGALHFLAGAEDGPDPLLRVILGIDSAFPLPNAVPPDAEERDLMDGLLRSVIDRWGRLGATSPDGLRETFLRRTGTLRFEETSARLRVTPGPFDMLLDGLPWSPGPVALPWMPLPCTVFWREDDNA